MNSSSSVTFSNVETSPSSCASMLHLQDRAADMPLTFALQALLIRHDASMAEAEQERFMMTAIIDKLEAEKRELEESNAKTVQENRNLLDQLEELNDSVSEADEQVTSLMATLQSTREELQRLTLLAGRTADLEAQVSAMEMEQANLHLRLKSSEDSDRSAVQRWQQAERTVKELQEQVDAIERDAKEERQRHVEIVGRIEKCKTGQQEFDGTAGSVKDTAALTTAGKDPGGSNVISHFVKDILQDNANLQMGIVELREMLMDSNTEVENLRHQMLLHQPISDGEGISNNPNLKAELSKPSPLEPLPELHVHHHYHRPERVVKEKISMGRRSRRKRTAATSSQFSISSGPSTPQRTSFYENSITGINLSQVAVNVSPAEPAARPSRWSMQSTNSESSVALSSITSSPRSGYRPLSVFDSIDATFQSSPPITPASSVPTSPMKFPAISLASNGTGLRSFSNPVPLQLKSLTDHYPNGIIHHPENDLANSTDFNFKRSRQATISEEIVLHTSDALSLAHPDADAGSKNVCSPIPENRAPVRRAASHESLLSISGTDIHTSGTRTIQNLGSRGGFSPVKPSLSGLVSSHPVLSPATATGRPTLHRRGETSLSDYSRLLHSAQTRPSLDEKSAFAFGKRLGGWVSGKWGVTTTTSPTNLRADATTTSYFNRRAPGVNQNGPIRGWRATKNPTPAIVEPAATDWHALQEALGEE